MKRVVTSHDLVPMIERCMILLVFLEWRDRRGVGCFVFNRFVGGMWCLVCG